MRLNQHCGIRGISGNGGDSTFSKLPYQFAVLLGYDDWYATLAQGLGYALTDATITHENNMPRKSALIDSEREFRQRIIRVLQGTGKRRTRSDPSLQGCDGTEHQGIQGHRNQRSSEDQASSFDRQQIH